MTTRIWCSLLLCTLACASACGGKTGPPAGVVATPSANPREMDSLALDVFSIAQDTVLSPLVSSWPATQVVAAQEDLEPEAGADPQTVYYRVQLFTTKDLAKAVAVRDEAEFDFGMTVRVDFETPYYKVRLGHFAAPSDADGLLSEARRHGYRGAWAVRVRALDTD